MQILITGGTGSLGTSLIPVLLKQNHHVTILSRDAHKQAILLARYPQIRAVLGDVRDRESILNACEMQDIVIHAAAAKRIERGDTDTREYLQINVLGTLNVAEACRLQGVAKALFIGSDKEVAAVNFYGMTKALGSHLWLAQNSPYRHTLFSCLRYGNVVESNGSVWHVWQRRLENKQPLIVKTPEPTRFFLSLTQAVAMVQNSLRYMRGGEIFVPGRVKAFSLWDLAREMQPESEWLKQPLNATEKQHEILVAETEYVESADDIASFNDIDLWRIWPKRTPLIYETPPLFSSREANKLSGKEVIRLLQGG